ncbi:MAG: autotransporter-associated beta strand repeat-containing protein, partial [Pirellulales bacterium]|nr:autotransporter-associated beta strand repeat-containing protein [Pirellulales bacterium]
MNSLLQWRKTGIRSPHRCLLAILFTLSIGSPLCFLADNAQAAALTWVGDWGTNYWDTTSALWTGGASVYTDGDHVTFDDIGSFTPPIDLRAALAPGSVTVNNSLYYDYVFSTTGSGSLTGTLAGGLTKSGDGTLTINTSNTFDGAVYINGGTLVVGNVNALGSTVGGTFVNNGGILDLYGKYLPVAETVTVAAGGTVVNTYNDTAEIDKLVLAGNATFGGSERLEIRGTPSFGNYTLTVDHTGDGTPGSYDGVRITSVATHDLKDAHVVQGTLAFHNSSLGSTSGTITVSDNLSAAYVSTLQIMETATPTTEKDLYKDSLVFDGARLYNYRGRFVIHGGVTLNTSALSSATEVFVNYHSTYKPYTVLADAVTGDGGITKTGSGDLILLGANTYSGTTTISAGDFRFGRTGAHTGTPGSGDFVLDGGHLQFYTDQAFSLGAVSGLTGNVYYGLDDSELLDNLAVTVGNNTYDGGTAIYKGAVILTTATGLGSTVAGTTIYGGSNNNGRLVLTNGITVDEPITLYARYEPYLEAPHIVNASGSNTLNGALTFHTGGTHVTLQSDDGLMTVAGDITSTLGEKYLNLQGDGDGTVTGSILTYGTGNPLHLNKNGAGTWTLESAGNTYDGGTVITGGTLALGASASIASSTGIDVQIDSFFDVSAVSGGFTLTGTQTLGGAGTVLGNVTTSGTNTLIPGDSAGTLTINGSLSLIGGDTLPYELTNNPGGANDRIDINKLGGVGGNLTAAGVTTVAVTMLDGSLGTGTYTLIDYEGDRTGDETNFSLSGVGSGTTRQSFNISVATPQQVNLVVTGAPLNLTWVGNNPNHDWDIVGTFNWDGGAEQYYELDSVTFNDTGSNASPVNLPADVTPSSLTVSNSAGHDYTFSGAGGIICSTGLTKSGAGNLTVANDGANAFGNDVTLNGGGLTFSGSNSNAVTGDLVVNGGVLSLANSGSNSISGNLDVADGSLTVAGSGVNTFSGDINIGTTGTVTFNRTDDVSVANLISGAGTLRQEGSGALTLSGNNSSFTGPVSVTGGTLKLNHASALGTTDGGCAVNGGTLDLGGKDIGAEQVTVQGTGVDNNGALVNTVNATAKTYNLILAGNATLGGSERLDIYGGSFGNYTLTVNHTGDGAPGPYDAVRFVQSGAFFNHDLKDANIVQGTLAFHNATLGQADGTITVTDNPSATYVTTLQLMKTMDYDVNTDLYKNLDFIGGRFYNYRGQFTLHGAVSLNDMATEFVVVSPSSYNTSLILADAVTGDGGITKTGDGPLYFLGNNSYSGTTTISAGTLSVGNGGTAGSLGPADVVNDATLIFNRDAAYTLSNNISGSGVVYYGGADALPNAVTTIAGNNSYTGTTYIDDGTVIAKSNTAFGDTAGETYVRSSNAGGFTGVLQLDGSAGNLNIAENFHTTGTGSTPSRYDGPGEIQNTAGDNTLSGNINIVSGASGAMIKVHGGTLTLSGTIANSISNDVRAMVFNGGNGTVT